MAYRMQTSVPELMDLSEEKDATFKLYGEEAREAGSFAACCLNARRLAERGVRNIQIFHRGWDAHNNLPKEHESQCKDIDRACYALITDLRDRGMLDDTLVVWGGEFGRTAYCQGKLTDKNYGRDHHPRCFTTWMAGGGVKPGITYGKTDELRIQHRQTRRLNDVPSTQEGQVDPRLRSHPRPSTPPFSTSSESIIASSPTATKVVTSASPTSTATSSRNCWLKGAWVCNPLHKPGNMEPGSTPFPRPPVRPDGSLRGLPQKRIPSSPPPGHTRGKDINETGLRTPVS